MTTPVNHRPPLGRVVESGLYVADLARAAAFYENVLGLRRLVADSRFRAYAAADTVLLLFLRGATDATVRLPGGTIPPHGAEGEQHVAFSVSREALAAWERTLTEQGVEIEGRTDWPQGGHSIYFRDPDGHLLELATPGLWDIPGG